MKETHTVNGNQVIYLGEISMKWLEYRKRLGIDFDDEERGLFCTALILNKLDDLFMERQDKYSKKDIFTAVFDSLAVSQEEYRSFCTITGTEYGDVLTMTQMKIREVLIANKLPFKKFLSYYMAFINCLSNREDGIKQKELLDLLDEAFNESRLRYAILQDDNEFYVFPKGAKELDNALISEPLEWLKDYPNTRKTYIIALRQYSEGIYIRDMADNLRKALETFLQEFLSNKKNLETNKNEICRYLGSQGIDAGVTGLFQPLINAYKNINDRIVKHNDAIDEKLLEFLLYQTGVLIRMVLSVKQVEKKK